MSQRTSTVPASTLVSWQSTSTPGVRVSDHTARTARVAGASAASYPSTDVNTAG